MGEVTLFAQRALDCRVTRLSARPGNDEVK
jgi:hypothetical protein